MRGEIKLKILEAIEKGFNETSDFIDDMVVAMTSPYGASVHSVEYRINKNRYVREIRKASQIHKRLQRQRVHEFISRLKKDGIVTQDKWRGIPKLTRQGFEILKKIQARHVNSLPLTRYSVIKDDFLKIVAFDVPESDRKKRNWIRNVLLNLGFKMVQKSVFVGKTKLPDEFTQDLIKLDLVDCIEIFIVSKHGTLRKMNLGK